MEGMHKISVAVLMLALDLRGKEPENLAAPVLELGRTKNILGVGRWFVFLPCLFFKDQMIEDLKHGDWFFK